MHVSVRPCICGVPPGWDLTESGDQATDRRQEGPAYYFIPTEAISLVGSDGAYFQYALVRIY